MFGDAQLTFLARRWIHGDTCLPLVERLRELGYDTEAAATARLALHDPECADAAALAAILRDIASEPDGWMDALVEFARAPSVERWRALMQFVPEEVWYERMRETVATLHRLGCDGDILFQCATLAGMHSGVYDLAASGDVDPEVIASRGDGSPARAVWLGLAAQAALARGERFAVVRFLREAMRDRSAVLASASIFEIRDAADDALNDELDRVGVPRM